MNDKNLVLWTQISGTPKKMGELYITDIDSRFNYENNYIKTGELGLGLLYPPEIFKNITIIRNRDLFFDFPPPIQSLLPPRSQKNFTRNLILSYLHKQGIFPQQGLETDLEILKLSGHGSIGHIDVFSSDHAADKWYENSNNNLLFSVNDGFGFSLKEFLTWMDDDASQFINIIGPTPSLGGAIPKLSLSIPKIGWNGQIGLPTRVQKNSNLTDIILKFEDEIGYPGLIELEVLGFKTHQKAGFSIPRYWPVEINGIKALAVERFDRDQNNTPLFLETLYSILASGSHKVSHHYSVAYDMIGKAIDNTKINIVENKKAAKEHLFSRLTFALLSGNGDLHLENLSILQENKTLKFSPVYDPVAMRAYSRHNMLCPAEMTFGDYGEKPFNEALLQFAKNLNISKKSVFKIISQQIESLQNYDNEINILKTLPDINKNNLIQIHYQIKEKMLHLLDNI